MILHQNSVLQAIGTFLSILLATSVHAGFRKTPVQKACTAEFASFSKRLPNAKYRPWRRRLNFKEAFAADFVNRADSENDRVEFGADHEGYCKHGFNGLGFDREGYDRDGYNCLGYDRYGYDRSGYSEDGFDFYNFGVDGYDQEGYDREGFNKEGYNFAGYDREGFPRSGYHDEFNCNGFDWNGENPKGYDKDGYEWRGVDRNGNLDPKYDYAKDLENLKSGAGRGDFYLRGTRCGGIHKFSR
jgi:hypothetical protein